MSIDIETLTLKQIREIASLAGCAKKKKDVVNGCAGEAVVVRAYSGVFFGYLTRKTGNCVELRGARQIYSWDSTGLTQKSNTCPDIAARGLGTGSKVSEPAARAFIEQVGAVFFVSVEAEKIINAQKWGTR